MSVYVFVELHQVIWCEFNLSVHALIYLRIPLIDPPRRTNLRESLGRVIDEMNGEVP